jgi:glucosyl-3-phosphoglycerate synthase
VLPTVSRWLAERTYFADELPSAEELLERKGDCTIALLLPALDEAPTIGRLLELVRQDAPVARLLDEVVVVDGGSRDGTAAIARARGARVVSAADVAPDHPPGGKGGSVWRGLQVTDSELIVVVDADLDPFRPLWLPALLAPLLLEDGVSLVKAAADRPLTVDGILHPRSGGRVTELVARPVLNALWPQLSGFAQPLSGELAGRRQLLEQLPFTTGYGLEIGMLIDALQLVGLHGLAQVDIGERLHRHQSDLALGRMASAVLRTALARAGTHNLPSELVQFVRTEGGALHALSTSVPIDVLPPVADVRGRDVSGG